MNHLQLLNASLPTLQSSRLALRAIALSDAFPLFVSTKHPQFNEHLSWPAPDAASDISARLELFQRQVAMGELAAASAVVRDTGEFVSMVRFFPTDEDSTFEVEVWTQHMFWDQGYTLELMALIAEAAFALPSVTKLLAQAADENVGSGKMLLNAGFSAHEAISTSANEGTMMLRRFELTRPAYALAESA